MQTASIPSTTLVEPEAGRATGRCSRTEVAAAIASGPSEIGPCGHGRRACGHLSAADRRRVDDRARPRDRSHHSLLPCDVIHAVVERQLQLVGEVCGRRSMRGPTCSRRRGIGAGRLVSVRGQYAARGPRNMSLKSEAMQQLGDDRHRLLKTVDPGELRAEAKAHSGSCQPATILARWPGLRKPAPRTSVPISCGVLRRGRKSATSIPTGHAPHRCSAG